VNTKNLDSQEVKGLGARIATERFDPNAFDGDGDGLVQDASEFERPSVPLNVGIPYGLNSITGDYSGRGYANLSPKEVAEKAVPDSPQRFVEQLLQHKRRDDLTNAQYLESFSKDLLENLGSTEPFDFSPQAVKVLRVALEKALTDSPSFHDEVGRFGMPPVVMFKKGSMTRLVGAAYEYEHNWMSFNPNTFSTGAIQNIKKRMNTSKLFVNGFGAKGTKKQLAGVEVTDYFRHEFGHYLNDIALETAPIGSRQMALASYYALDDWESTDYLPSTLGIDDAELNALGGQWKEIVDAIETNKDMPDGAPFVGTQYGQTNPAEMFAEGVSAYLSDDEDIHGLLNPVLKAHIQEVLGHPIRTVTPRKRTEERKAIGGLRSAQKPKAPTGGNVQMPSFYKVPNISDPNKPYEVRHGNLGISPTSTDWLKDASDDEIAEAVVVRSVLDHATYMAQMSVGDGWNNLSRAEQNMEIQMVLPQALSLEQYHAVDFSPEAIKRAQDLVKESLKDPAFAWYVRTFGLPPVTVTTTNSAKEARLKGQVSGAVGNIPGSGAGAWFQPLGNELTHGITINLEAADMHPSSPAGEVRLWQQFADNNGLIQLPWNVQGDPSSILRHEYGHYLYWKLTRNSSDKQLLALGMTLSQIKANRAELRSLFDDTNGWAFGDPAISTPLTSMYQSVTAGKRVNNKNFNPSHFLDLASQGYPVVFSGYAMADPQETFAEGFASFTSPHANVRGITLSSSFRNTLARLSGITVTGETRGKHTTTGGTHDKPWERNISGLASRSATLMGKDFNQVAKELELTDKEIHIAEDELDRRMEEVTSGELMKRPIHTAIEKDKKRLLDSIRLEVGDDGIPMVMADPNPLLFAYIPDKRDWSKVSIPKLETIKNAAEYVRKYQSEDFTDDDDDAIDTFNKRLLDIVKALSANGGQKDIGEEVGTSWLSLYLGGLSDPKSTLALEGNAEMVHDAFGHAGIGRGFDRHGEWANPLAVISMLDGPTFDDFTPEMKNSVARYMFREFGVIRFEQKYGTGFGENYDEDRDSGSWQTWLNYFTGDTRELISMLDDSDKTQVLNNDGSPMSGLRSGKPLQGATRSDVQSIAKQDLTHAMGLASKASVRESSRVIGEGGDASKPSILSRAKEKLRLNDRQVGHVNTMTNQMHSIFRSGKIYDESIHPAIDDRRKELLDSIRIVRAEGGMTMIVAEPNPIFNAYLPVKRDWASIELPPREAVAEALKKLQLNKGTRRSDAYGIGAFNDHLSSILDEVEKMGEGPGKLPYEEGEGNYVSYVQQYYDSLRDPIGSSRLLYGTDGQHDAFGHFGTGRGYDRHGEWANYLAMKDMIDASPLTDEEKDDVHRFWFREYGWLQLGKRGDLDEIDETVRFKFDDYDGPISDILDILDSGHNGLDDAPTEDMPSGKSISDTPASELRQAAKNDVEAQLNRNSEPELGIADLRVMSDSELQSMLSSTDDPLLRDNIKYTLSIRGITSKTLPWVAVVTKSFIDNAPQEKSLEQDSPELWKEIRKNLLKGKDGGKAGEWTARKQQMLVKMYKDAGGGFRGTLRSTNRSIKRWSRERYARSEETSNGARRYSDAGVSRISNYSQAKKNKRTVIGRSRGDKATTKRKPRTMGRNLRGS
jgi:uncharacterized membrane protein